MTRLTTGPIDVSQLIEEVRSPGCGAVVLFVGTVRDHTGDRQVLRLHYEAYPELAEHTLAELAGEVRGQWPAVRIAIVHRQGILEVGEISVAIAAASPHRDEAFRAVRHVIERIKEVLPVWKKEIFLDGQEWVEGHGGGSPGPAHDT